MLTRRRLVIWQMLGIYPVVTQTVYLVGSPWFPDLNMTVNGNQTLRITVSTAGTQNATAAPAPAPSASFGQENFYVQSLKINGEDWNQNWFEHEDVMVNGGSIEFELGPNFKVWETGDVPPSPGHVVL